MTTDPFRLLMVSAMYENGGNVTHRLLDGHPQLYVYPFESQLGTHLVRDELSSMFPSKYRWPVFDLEADAAHDYAAFIDEEMRVRARTPHVSKFRRVDLQFDDDERKQTYIELIDHVGRSRAHNVEAFFRATFAAWRNRRRSGRECVHVGYSPIIAVDAIKILDELPEAHILHVIRNPWSAYADTKKRPVPLSLPHYMLGWTITQRAALLARQCDPRRVHLVRIEDVLDDPRRVLGDVCARLGLEAPASLSIPSWNGEPLVEVYPWGTIREPTPTANRATAAELSPVERDAVRQHAAPYLEVFDYAEFI